MGQFHVATNTNHPHTSIAQGLIPCTASAANQALPTEPSSKHKGFTSGSEILSQENDQDLCHLGHFKSNWPKHWKIYCSGVPKAAWGTQGGESHAAPGLAAIGSTGHLSCAGFMCVLMLVAFHRRMWGRRPLERVMLCQRSAAADLQMLPQIIGFSCCSGSCGCHACSWLSAGTHRLSKCPLHSSFISMILAPWGHFMESHV